MKNKKHLPTEAAQRKKIPIATGFIDYFPDAIAAVAELSRIGNDQHNPGKPLFWDRTKSTDEADTLMRHFLERGTIDTDGVRHSTKVAWRALALLQKEIEAEDSPIEDCKKELCLDARCPCGEDLCDFSGSEYGCNACGDDSCGGGCNVY